MGYTKDTVIKLLLSLVIVPVCFCDVRPLALDSNILSQKTIGDCLACKLFIESFLKGLKRTERSNYGGGDTAWEEEKHKTLYRRSEMRLVDIQEGICKDVKKYSVQCHHMAEKAEEIIENWWTQDSDQTVDLHQYICIEKLELCCPKHHYGRNCAPCHGDHANLCNNNGKCRGDGTRKGNGTCLCDEGYMGETCGQCSEEFYISYKDDTKMLCSHCHPSCTGGCRGGSQKDCVACKPGYTFNVEQGCLDIDECDNIKRCTEDEFCVNSHGSYACILCDKACEGCHGDGPDMCRKCAMGYSLQDKFCIADGGEDMSKLGNNRNEEL